MLWVRVKYDRQHGLGGSLTLAGRCRSDVPLGSCREEPGLFAEQWIQVQTPPRSGGTQTILLCRASSSVAEAITGKRVALSTCSASARSFARGDAFQVSAVNIGGRTCPGACHFASAATPLLRDLPPPCRRRHRITVHGPPNAVGALRETLAGDVFEALGEMPETRRTSTTAERSAGCEVRSLRTVGGGVSGRGSARRQRLVAASSAPPPRATAIGSNPDPL